MTPEDLKDLKALQDEILCVEESPWQPRCVTLAFCSADEPFVLTMQAWIDLEAVRSPFLLGRLPTEEDAFERFYEAFRAFGHDGTSPLDCEPEGLVLLGRKMVRAISVAFAMRVQLEPPVGMKLGGANNGMGLWLPLMTCLISQLGLSMAEARALPVAQAYALVAAHRCNEGWSVGSESYASRDVPDTQEDESHV